MDLDSIFRVSPESFDGQVSLDPFKERLNLPPVTIYVGNYKRSKFKVVGYKGDNLILFSILELYETQVFRVLFLADIATKVNGLVSNYAHKIIGVVVDINHIILHSRLCPCNEIGPV